MKLLSKKTISLIAAMTMGTAYAEGFSTAIGTMAGQQINSQTSQVVSEIDKAAIIEAFEAAINGSPKMSDEEMRQALDAEMKLIQDREAEKAQANLVEAKAFIDDYAKGEGVEKTENGVYYKVINSGNGASPTDVETPVSVHYVGKLPSGDTFDSSRERGEPATFALNQVIPGWREAVQMMKVGDRWEVVIPPELGYGPQGNGPIPGNSALVFDIELLGIEPKSEEK